MFFIECMHLRQNAGLASFVLGNRYVAIYIMNACAHPGAAAGGGTVGSGSGRGWQSFTRLPVITSPAKTLRLACGALCAARPRLLQTGCQGMTGVNSLSLSAPATR
eukprot:COSAG06_NODE_2794_length_6274_cov_2.952551_4_plen_106_part_00